ncbi:MAG: class I SAM-dependent methyltransferase [Cyclobacteriaceae bacterium]
MIEDKILSAYEALADRYNELIDTKPHNAYYDRPNTLSLFPEELEGKTVLDAACGPGKYAEVLIDRGAEVIGFDMSTRMVELARERNQGRGQFFVHNLSEELPTMGSGSCDVVLCALAMHYVKDWSVTVREFHRVLRPEGKLILSLEHPFFEYNYFKSKNYFSVEAVRATWGGFGKPVDVPSYRRPLGECLSPLTDNGFLIDNLLEPKPTEAFKEADPKYYEKLNAFPAFMCLRAIKRPV